MTGLPERACAVCDVTEAESDYALIPRTCGHVLCPICYAGACPVCDAAQPNEEEPTPLAQAIEDGASLMWAYGELYGIPEPARYAAEHFALALTGLRLWAESAGIDASDAWRDAWQRSVAVRSARKVS